MGKKNDTSAPASIVYVEEAVLDDTESAIVLTSRLSEHDLVELLLTFLQNAVGQCDFVLSDFEFELFFEQLDHSLHNTHRAHEGFSQGHREDKRIRYRSRQHKGQSRSSRLNIEVSSNQILLSDMIVSHSINIACQSITYLDDQVLQRLLVLWRFLIEI